MEEDGLGTVWYLNMWCGMRQVGIINAGEQWSFGSFERGEMEEGKIATAWAQFGARLKEVHQCI
jgi:hypothetical protein